eukprot:9851552-Heterocapsa_arctica.AAC.1
MSASSVSRDDAARVQKYSRDDFDNIGFNPELAVRMSNPTRTTRPYGPGGGGTLDQKLHAASAQTNKQMVELWLIDTGCAHDLVSLADITRSCDKLCSLADH